jgi:GAF domain-containing protein
LTGSKFGFIGELNEGGLFDTLAISDPGWDACKMPESEAVKAIKNMPVRGVDRGTLRDGISRIVNDPASHPDTVGVPEGHPPIACFLGVPLKHGGKTIGMIGVANKESGYELADQEAMEALSVAFVEALMGKRQQRLLQHSEEKYRLLAENLNGGARFHPRSSYPRTALSSEDWGAISSRRICQTSCEER